MKSPDTTPSSASASPSGATINSNSSSSIGCCGQPAPPSNRPSTDLPPSQNPHHQASPGPSPPSNNPRPCQLHRPHHSPQPPAHNPQQQVWSRLDCTFVAQSHIEPAHLPRPSVRPSVHIELANTSRPCRVIADTQAGRLTCRHARTHARSENTIGTTQQANQPGPEEGSCISATHTKIPRKCSAVQCSAVMLKWCEWCTRCVCVVLASSTRPINHTLPCPVHIPHACLSPLSARGSEGISRAMQELKC